MDTIVSWYQSKNLLCSAQRHFKMRWFFHDYKNIMKNSVKAWSLRLHFYILRTPHTRLIQKLVHKICNEVRFFKLRKISGFLHVSFLFSLYACTWINKLKANLIYGKKRIKYANLLKVNYVCSINAPLVKDLVFPSKNLWTETLIHTYFTIKDKNDMITSAPYSIFYTAYKTHKFNRDFLFLFFKNEMLHVNGLGSNIELFIRN